MTLGRSLASPGSVGCQGAGRSLKMNLALGLGRRGPRRASQKEPAIGDGSQFWEKTQGKSIHGTAVYRISHIPEEMPATPVRDARAHLPADRRQGMAACCPGPNGLI